MPPDDLHKYLAALDQAGELSRVTCPVDAQYEVAAIINAVCKSQTRRALLFEHVSGYNLPLAANLFGSPRRMSMALGVADGAELSGRLRRDLAASPESSSELALQRIVAAGPAAAREEDPCLACDITDQGLAALPAISCWPGDGGRYLTLAQVFTCHPDTREVNCGMYRVQLLDRDRALLRCHPGSGGAAHLAAWRARGKAMPVAIALGGPPVMTWLAGVPLPAGVTEQAFASYLTGQPLRMTTCRAVPLAVPADAEIVIEGWVTPGEESIEGPFGNHTGWYAPAAPAPVVRVAKVSMRDGAIYPCTLVGPPPMENAWLGQFTAQLLLPLLQHDHPWVADLHLPAEGLYHRAAMVAIAPDCALTQDEIGQALRQSLLLKNARLLVLLDRDAALRDAGQVYWRLLNAPGWPGFCRTRGEQVVLDARTPAGYRPVVADAPVLAKVKARWTEYGIDQE